MPEQYYYHAGAQRDADGSVIWSDYTRRSKAAAEREARRMARSNGRSPIVEYWSREHGLRPGDCEMVAGAYDVAGDEPGKE